MFDFKLHETILKLFLFFICIFSLVSNCFLIYIYVVFQDVRQQQQLINKHGDTLEEKSLTICSNTDYININYQHVICPDAATAKVN